MSNPISDDRLASLIPKIEEHEKGALSRLLGLGSSRPMFTRKSQRGDSMSDDNKTIAEQLIADAERIIENEHDHIAQIAEKFFTKESDYTAPCGDGCKGCAFCRRESDAPPETTQPRWRGIEAQLEALKPFVRAMNELSPHDQRCAIYWLADRYLGIKWWGLR